MQGLVGRLHAVADGLLLVAVRLHDRLHLVALGVGEVEAAEREPAHPEGPAGAAPEPGAARPHHAASHGPGTVALGLRRRLLARGLAGAGRQLHGRDETDGGHQNGHAHEHEDSSQVERLGDGHRDSPSVCPV
jgi:hypothetical protein